MGSNKTRNPIIITDSLVARFWEKVDRVDDATSCWIWNACLIPAGYGMICGSAGKRHLAHRVSYAINVGPIDPKLMVLHRCVRTRACVRPDHLYLGSGSQNTFDSVEQGTHARFRHPGSKNPMAILTEDQVLSIRERVASGTRQRRIAEELGLSEATISNIVHRKSWKDV